MGIRRTRGAARCARAYGLAQSRPKQGGTQGTAERTQGQDQKKGCVSGTEQKLVLSKKEMENEKKEVRLRKDFLA
jgi:hypothetical protein